MICLSDSIEVKRLRNEVQLLRDELAIMKRKYEDIIYNLDTDNFSSRFVKEQGDMRTAIKVTAKGIETKVSKEDLDKSLSEYSTTLQTASLIKTTVSREYITDLVGDDLVTNAILQTEIQQTADLIRLTATETKEYAEGYVTDILSNGGYVTESTFKSQFDVYADGIYATVEENYESVNDEMNTLRSSIASVLIEADNISSRVENVENGEYGGHTLFRQTSDTFLFDGDKAVFTGCVYLTDSNDDKAFSIFLQEEDSWNYEAFYMWGYGDYTNTPLILGTTSGAGVYIGNYTDNDRVATRGWVLDNAGSGGGSTVAKFG